MIQIGLLKPSASSRKTRLFHAVTIKKPQQLAAAFPLEVVKDLEHLTKDNYKVSDIYGSSCCAVVRPLNWLQNTFEAERVLKPSFLYRGDGTGELSAHES